MKKLIAESGSTKTVWVLLENGTEIWRTKSIGFNPHIVSRENALEELEKSSDLGTIRNEALELHFYGAGCSTQAMRDLIGDFLAEFFLAAEIIVESDLLAAARALCGNEPGLIGILGTGTNLSFYTGKELVIRNVSPGFLLGDELSGNWIGKHLLHDHLYNVLPEPLESEMIAFLGKDKSATVDNLYASEFPNRFLAALAPIAIRHLKHPYVERIIEQGFLDWKRFQLSTYPEREDFPIHFVGGIAMELKQFLTDRLKKEGLSVGNFDNQPINALLRYHSA